MQKLTSPFDLIKEAVTIFVKKENLIYLIQIYLPVAFFSVLSIAQNYLPENIRNSSSVWMVSGVVLLQLIYLLISVFVALSGIIAVGKIIGGGELSVRRTYESALQKYWIFLLLSSILTLIYLFGFLLLIIPGVIFIVWFAFSRFVAIEKGLGVKESLLKSKDLVKGIYWKILGRLLVFGAFTVVVQMLFTMIPYGVGSIVNSLCGGLFILPIFLLYKEISA